MRQEIEIEFARDYFPLDQLKKLDLDENATLSEAVEKIEEQGRSVYSGGFIGVARRSGRYPWLKEDEDFNAWDGAIMHSPYYYLLKDMSKRRPDLKEFDPELEYNLLENEEAPSSNYITRNVGVAMKLVEALTRKEHVEDELVRALKYYLVILYASYVRIDAKLAKKDLGIDELVKKYLGVAT